MEANTEGQDNDPIYRDGELPKIDLLDYLLFVPFFFAFLGTLVAFDVIFRLFYFSSLRTRERLAAMFNRGIVRSLRLVRTRVSYLGRQSLPDDRPYLFLANHQSMFDISILHQAFSAHRPKFVAKKELSRGIPGVSICLRLEGSALIDRGNPRQAIPAIHALGRQVNKDGSSVILFPEGTRARRGRLKPFKTAGVLHLLRTAPNAEIVPVALDESWRIAVRPMGPVARGIEVKVMVGEPITRNGITEEEIIQQAEGQIQEMLRQLRS